VPTREELRQIVDRYAAAVTAGDLEAIIALFAADAVRTDPIGTPTNVGRDAIRAAFTNLGSGAFTLFDVVKVHTAGDSVAFNFKVTVTAAGATTTIEGIEVFTVNDDGLIQTVVAYWDDTDVNHP
jgi:steroid Delta-isomerase